jgi:hypothetical protein
LYYAAEGKSSLSRYGNANDFSKYVARAVKGYVPGQVLRLLALLAQKYKN